MILFLEIFYSYLSVPSVNLQYDVFVSYSGNDQDWVLNTLFKTMTSQGYEVCIDFKDFTPGKFRL